MNNKPFRILLFGANGMLGKYVSSYFKKQGLFVLDVTREQFDISKEFNNTNKLILSLSPTHVINCAGIINKRPDVNLREMFIVNSHFPQILGKICKKESIKLVHITTNCVYSGTKGVYSNEDIPDCNEDYGISKSLSDMIPGCVIRCSIIGEEKENERSLVSWIFSNKGKTVDGFQNHLWNGVTCLELAKFLFSMVTTTSFWEGVKNIVSKTTLSKAELIRVISEIYNLDIKVNEIKAEYCNRTLKGDIVLKDLKEQIEEMKEYTI